MPVIEETLASHLSPSLAPSWKLCAELSGQLAHSGSLQGASKSSQRYRSPPHPFSWPQNECQEECAPPISANRASWGSFGFHSDAGPFGSCPDIQFYSMSDPLQARPSCLCRYLLQAVRPHGSGLPCVAPRVASHEAVPLVDERAEVTPHCTSHSPYQGVAQLLSTPFTMAGPHFSPERGENGCDPPSPNDYDRHINDGLGRGLRRQTGEWGMDRRVPFLAHKLPGTQGCLPGFDVFSPRSRGASYHSQNGQYGGCVPHKPSGRFTVAHPGQACTPSSPLFPGQVPQRKELVLGTKEKTACKPVQGARPWTSLMPVGTYRDMTAFHVPGILNLAADFLSRQKLRPGEWMLNRQTVSQIWDLFGKAEVDLLVSQESSQCPLWFSLSFPTTLGIDAFAHPWPNVSLYAFPSIKLIPAVLCRVKVSSVPFWPSQTWFSELTPLLYRSPWEIPIRRDLLSQLQGRIWHPQPELWKLWVWPIQGQGPWWIFYLSRFRRPSPVPEPLLLGSCTLSNGASLGPGVWFVQ